MDNVIAMTINKIINPKIDVTITPPPMSSILKSVTIESVDLIPSILNGYKDKFILPNK